MEKTNYREQELDLAERLLRFFESEGASRQSYGRLERVTQPATHKQLRLLSDLGIRPKWHATKQEASEMILHYKAVLASVNHRL